MRQAATAGLRLCVLSTPTGAALEQVDVDKDLVSFREESKRSAELLRALEHRGGIRVCTAPGAARLAAEISQLLLNVINSESYESDARAAVFRPVLVDLETDFFNISVQWSHLVHSGWPVFLLAAVVEVQIWSLGKPFWRERVPAVEPCTREESTFREEMVVLGDVGRTSRILDSRTFLKQSVASDADGLGLLHAILYEQPVRNRSCSLAAMATALLSLADAHQCNWQRAEQRREVTDALIDRAQHFLRVGAKSSSVRPSLFGSRWSVLTLLSRLQPPSPPGENIQASRPLVSWSSREAESGNGNWAAVFASEVFGGIGVELREDVECADIFVFRHKVPINFGGVLIFVDGETGPADSKLDRILAGYPASIVIGPVSAGAARHFPVPYASTSFASRTHTPAVLSVPPRPGNETRQFAAYVVFECWPHRELFFHLLDSAARARGLEVKSLSRCGTSTATMDDRRSVRYSATYYDDAVEMYSGFRFALVFENRLSRRYVTEKIVNALLAGTVPIYWGSPFVLRLFSAKCFIYVNAFPTFEAAVQRVIEVEENATLYRSFLTAPRFTNNSHGPWLFSWHSQAPAFGGKSLREELVDTALALHRGGIDGQPPAAHVRPWKYYGGIFEGRF